ncbi:hypothetical protein BC939DRAFT_441744 [Gamsiella multidivaricata]|uniref:uncharacterized protein n=1 Tax=Gamsiella multidivaricata TaxID=101098 RepID=UPI0022209DDB|nr:uncharacterized protein BC939DRAFT_441744 [Gamsiella multidivaricata]KAI7829387.1 hypothetical protein BC939DRAFT_441744 [Gamsiella multidivaricata]
MRVLVRVRAGLGRRPFFPTLFCIVYNTGNPLHLHSCRTKFPSSTRDLIKRNKEREERILLSTHARAAAIAENNNNQQQQQQQQQQPIFIKQLLRALLLSIPIHILSSDFNFFLFFIASIPSPHSPLPPWSLHPPQDQPSLPLLPPLACIHSQRTIIHSHIIPIPTTTHSIILSNNSTIQTIATHIHHRHRRCRRCHLKTFRQSNNQLPPPLAPPTPAPTPRPRHHL